jgi:cation diffusion facilitator family transporter
MAAQDDNEKNIAALSSVGAAVFLTGLKIVVGLLSGSLGILAEAAHSTLDFAAAIITFFAVRAASKPADREHTYGHGKVENLSALVETLLLLGTCGWIIYQSVTRLASGQVIVKASIWTFAVMFVSIVVDVSRSRMLYRIAAKHRSQALEADALHFSTDIWSSFSSPSRSPCINRAGLRRTPTILSSSSASSASRAIASMSGPTS